MIKVWNRVHALHVLKRTKVLSKQKRYPYIIIYDTRHIPPTKERHNVQFKK